MDVAATTAERPLRWQLLAPIGVVSLITMPLTAIWFLLLGCATFMVAAACAAVTRSADRATAVLRTGASIGVGLLLGPIVYLILAVLT